MCSWLSNCSWTQESGLCFSSHTKLLSTGPRVLVNWCGFKWLFSRPAASCCFLGSTWGWLRWAGWSNTTKGVSLNMCCAMQFWCNFLGWTCASDSLKGAAQPPEGCFNGFSVQERTWTDLSYPTGWFGGFPLHFIPLIINKQIII